MKNRIQLRKIFGCIRALLYNLIFASFGIPGYFGKPIYIYGGKGINIGKRVGIYPGARLETHYGGKITIHDNASIGQNVHIVSGGNLSIGKDTTISGNVFITDIDHSYTEIDKHILDQEYIVSDTRISENCFIGYGACILAGTRLGKQCIVGAQAVVRGNFPDYSVIAGIPAKIIKKYSHENNKWGRIDGK
ncbi:MAG: acyltransferase [Actinomycetia bacterium]|nr:acyltransferase [Actinomycetes bacterium]